LSNHIDDYVLQRCKVKISLSIFKASVLAMICSSVMFVVDQDALGITTNLGTTHKTAVTLQDTDVGFVPVASSGPGKGASTHMLTKQRNKMIPNNASNEPSKAAISKREASAATTAAAAAAALFGAAL
jgi:hypothetical protein